jgi:RNA polymerase sigma-70 factor (ECF subfamily)
MSAGVASANPNTHGSRGRRETGSSALDAAFRAHKRFLWGLSYRMTGSAADADDVVQDTFARALSRPPADTDGEWRPWLVRVTMNLARDALRRRRRQAYVGPWLPSPIETGEDAVDGDAIDAGDTESRYALLESVSYGFLLALEALTPQQRAVLLLREVFDYSNRETAAALDLSEANVKVTLHRARRAMRAYERLRSRPTRCLQERTRQALAQLMNAFMSNDLPAIERLLAAEVRAVSDGGGEFHAARVPIVGPARVAKFYYNISSRRLAGMRAAVRHLNGLPALVAELPEGRPGEARHLVLRCDVAPDGRITALHTVLATRKLTGIDFS